MLDETPVEPAPEPVQRGPGRPPLDIGHQDVTKIIELMENGMPRAIACKEAGLKNYRLFKRLMEEDEEFRDRVHLIEMSRKGLAELNIYSAMVKQGDENPQASRDYLELRWRLQSLNEAKAARKRAEAIEDARIARANAIEDRKLALEEQKAAQKAGNGPKTGLPLDLSKLDPAELANLDRLLEKASPPPAPGD